MKFNKSNKVIIVYYEKFKIYKKKWVMANLIEVNEQFR